MKKIFALTLAVAMVLSLASVAFAADTVYAIDSIEEGPHKIPSKKTYVGTTVADPISYGNTIYYVLRGSDYADNKASTPSGGSLAAKYVTNYDAIKGVKISTDWSVGSDWVSKVEIVKKRYGDGGEYIYFLAISFKSAPVKAESADVIGEIILKKSSGDNKINRGYGVEGAPAIAGAEKGETAIFNVDVELHYGDGDAKGGVITDGSKTFEFDGTDNWEDEEYEFTFTKWVDCNFIVNTVGQGKIVLKATTDYNADIAALYPEANLDFFIGNGATFNKTGEMFILADEGTFIYEIKNGALVAIKGATYDEYDEGFYFKTRTLGQYVVSDVELDLAAGAEVVTPADPGSISVVEPGTTPSVVVNPSTGAAV